jgi:two-component system, NtrC family, sensor kinase
MNPQSASDQTLERTADEARLAAVLSEFQIGVVISGPDARLRLCNQAALDLLGLTESELRGQAVADPSRSVVREDGSDFSSETLPLAIAIATGKPVRNIVMGVYHPARHQRIWLLSNADPQLDGDGAILQVIATYSDITERRGFEARLAVADRLAAMGTLAAGIAHEINNPLAFITANLSYADGELADPASLSDPDRLAEIRHAIREARGGADRVRDIVTEMRTLARGTAARRPINVTRVLELAAGAIASEIRTRAKLVTKLVEVPLVDADEARLGQVFVNLLLNAVDAIIEGQPSLNEITVATMVDDHGRVVVEVRDSGIGIAPELHQRIFDPFFTNKPVGRGMGLGLAICHHIITDLGGTISVESAPERGSAFRVALPAAATTVFAPDSTGGKSPG